MINHSSLPIERPLIPLNIKTISAQIGAKTYTLEIARTMEEKGQGLSDRNTMASDHGMIFIFKHKGHPSFTMHGMKFPLDFVWLDHNKVVELTEYVQRPTPVTASESLMPITPEQDFDLAIELNAGEIKANGIKITDVVSFISNL
ncbi:DUF192 domain-containing protein [Candidatus Saganbacteria bacterium]|nr:DUF192 domain-containing protein [Candidatus Saganbacteria bacterium]